MVDKVTVFDIPADAYADYARRKQLEESLGIPFGSAATVARGAELLQTTPVHSNFDDLFGLTRKGIISVEEPVGYGHQSFYRRNLFESATYLRTSKEAIVTVSKDEKSGASLQDVSKLSLMLDKLIEGDANLNIVKNRMGSLRQG